MNPYGLPQPDFGSPLPTPQNPIQSVMATANTPVKRKGMFGGVSIDPAAGIAGFLAGLGNPAGIAALQQLHQQRMLEQQQAAAQQEYQQHRADDNTDWQSRYDYEAAHPKPSDSEFERIAAAAGYAPGTPEYIALMKKKADTMADPPRYQFVDGVGLVQVGGGGAPSAAPQPPPPAPVGTLKPYNPGGPTPPASGGF